MRADLIERMKSGLDALRARASRGGITSAEVFSLTNTLMDLMARQPAADALASQEPVACRRESAEPYVRYCRDCCSHIHGSIYGEYTPTSVGSSTASPVVPVAAKAEADGWRPIETAPKDSKARLVWVPENQCIYCVSWQSADGPSHPAGWSIFGGGWRSMVQGATHWMPPPAAPTCEGEGQ